MRNLPDVLLCLLLVTTACAPPTAPPEPGQADGATAARLFTGARLIVGDGTVVENASFVVRNGVIVEVGMAGQVDVPRGSAVVDVSGQTVMPAFVNTHAHLGWEGYTSWGSENFTRNNLIDHLQRHAYYGVGTIISTGSDKEEVALQVRQEQRLGQVGGARYLVSPGMGTPGGGPNPRFTADDGWWGLHHVSSAEEARALVQMEAAKGIEILKIWVDARDERRGARVKLRPELYRAILDEAHVRDIRVIAHATTLSDHKQLVRAGARRFIHMPYDRDVDEECLALVEARNVFIVPTLGMVTKREPYRRPVFEDPFFQEQVSPRVVTRLRDAATNSPTEVAERTAADEERSERIVRNFEKLKDHIILGTDAGAVGDFFGYADHLELELFVRFGMTPSEAIVAATMRAAEAFGLVHVGTLEAGKSADFVVLDANPLDEITNTQRIARVSLRGDEIDRDALRTTWTQ